MNVKLIKNDTDYQAALNRIDSIFDAHPGTPEGDELELLVHLVDEYEEKEYPIHPPDPISAIRFRMEQQGLKQVDLTPYFGSKSRVSEVLNGKRSLTLSMIRKLHKGLGIPASVLLQEPGQSLSPVYDRVDWKKLPLAEMLKRKWFPDFEGTTKDLLDNAEEILGPLLFPGGHDSRELSMVARQSMRSEKKADENALWAWQARVLQLSGKQTIGEYDIEAMNTNLMHIVLRLSKLDDGPQQAMRLLNENGIATVVLHHLPGTRLDGAAMLRPDGSPVIALTLRYDRLDNFWFTLAHELAHVVKHLAKGDTTAFLDDLQAGAGGNVKEKEADACAAELLLPSESVEESQLMDTPTPTKVREVAMRNHLHPAVVAGRIRYEKNNYKILSSIVGVGKLRKLFPRYKAGEPI